MELGFAVLADHVRVENGLGYLIAGGIDRITAAAVPTGQNLGIFAAVDFTYAECGRPHRFEMIGQSEDGERLLALNGVVEPSIPDGHPSGWPIRAVFGVNLGMPLPRYGHYSLELLVDDHNLKTLRFRVVPPSDGP